MLIIGKPIEEENYICVNSERASVLHKLGFVPIYRDIKFNNIYFVKNENIVKVVEEKWNLIV